MSVTGNPADGRGRDGGFAHRAARLSYLLREARKRSPRFLVHKLADAVARELRGVAAWAGLNPYGGRDEARFKNVWFSSEGADSVSSLIADIPAGECEALLQRADRIVAGYFDLLGYEAAIPGKIDWHQDYRSGRRWPTRFHSRYTYSEIIDLGQPSDVKFVWEMSRLQFLPVLALAYRVSGDAIYVSRMEELLRSWDEANPVGYGIAWTSAMDASHRAISLIFAAALLCGSAAYERFVDHRFLQRLNEHGRFISRNLEFSDINGNHHTACLLGLFFLGTALESREGDTWKRRATDGLRREIFLQTYDDGLVHEGSLPYHRFVVELFAAAFILSRRIGEPFGGRYRERLELMFEVVLAYLKPNGEVPLWGDADDGRVLPLGSQPINDHRYMLRLGAGLFARNDLWKASESSAQLDALVWLTATERHATVPSSPIPIRPALRTFNSAGIAILRVNGHYAAIDASDVGLRGRGGHGHNDALNVEIALAGQDVLVDSGCYTYTASVDRRRQDLSARAHNVVLIGGDEPAPLVEGGIPHATACPAALLRSGEADGIYFAEAEHRGYAGADTSVVVRRRVELHPVGSVLLRDTLLGDGRVQAEGHLQFAPELEVEATGPHSAILANAVGARFLVALAGPEDVSLELGRSSLSTSYGHEVSRSCAHWRATVDLPFTIDITVQALA